VPEYPATASTHALTDAGNDHRAWRTINKHGLIASRRASMNIEKGRMVPLGYGKYFRSDSIVGLEPVEEGRGPGQRTKVYVEHLPAPIVASRSEGAILRDMVEMPKEITKIREQRELLSDIMDTIGDINPLLRSIIRDQGKWDLDRLEERIREVLRQDEE
jgi:hypothetical protein